MYLIYRNHCNPYAIGDDDTKKKFQQIIELTMKKTQTYSENIINCVFMSYEKESFPAELIVRVPHMLASYHHDKAKILELREHFAELFDFYNQITLPLIANSLNMVKMMTEQPEEIKWSDLTTHIKTTILNSQFCFHDRKMTFNELNFDINCKAFDKIITRDLVDRIICGEFAIEGKIESKQKFYFERSLVSKSNKDQRKTLQDLVSSKANIILVSDFAGSGKTTLFKNFATQMRSLYPKKWISYVDLKRHISAFNNLESKNSCIHILKQIFKTNDFEMEVFIEISKRHGVHILWDGIDEISPFYKEEITQIIKECSEIDNCQQWISTRSEHEAYLEKTFKIQAFKICELGKKEQNGFLNEFARAKGLKTSECLDFMNKCMSLITSIHRNQKDDFCLSPLFLNMIAESDAELIFEKNGEKVNIAMLYEKFVQKKFVEAPSKKGKLVMEEHNEITTHRFGNIWKMHQFYAMKMLICPESKLNVLKRSSNWNINSIYRYGLIHPDNTDLKYGFIHRTFAEFFVAYFIFDEVYNCSDSPNYDEATSRLNCLIYFAFHPDGSVIRDFILDLIKNVNVVPINNAMNECMDKNLLNLVLKGIQRSSFGASVEAVEFLSKYLKSDEKNFKKFWYSNDKRETLFIKLLIKFIQECRKKDTKMILFDKIYKLRAMVKNEFPLEKDQKKILQGINQRGNISFNLAKCNLSKEDNEHIISIINDILGIKLKSITKKISTFKNKEQKEIYYHNFIDIMERKIVLEDQSSKTTKHFARICHFFRNDKTRKYELLSQLNDSKQNMLHFLHYFESSSVVNFILQKYKNVCQKENLFMQRDIDDFTPLVNILQYSSLNIVKKVVNFLFFKLKMKSELKRMVLERFENSFTLLHYSALNPDIKVFNFIVHIYKKNISITKISEIFLNSGCELNAKTELFLEVFLIRANHKQRRNFFNFIQILFENSTEDLKNFLWLKDNDNQTIFNKKVYISNELNRTGIVNIIKKIDDESKKKNSNIKPTFISYINKEVDDDEIKKVPHSRVEREILLDVKRSTLRKM
jgi:hypothetical protein